MKKNEENVNEAIDEFDYNQDMFNQENVDENEIIVVPEHDVQALARRRQDAHYQRQHEQLRQLQQADNIVVQKQDEIESPELPPKKTSRVAWDNDVTVID